jgi:type IV secretory pathway TraG/TraD family ATPase VirD4
MAMAAHRKARHAAPYAAGLTVALAAAVLMHSLAPFWVAIGLVAMHAGLRLLEAVDIRRNGGRRAARQRRKYQGMASRRDSGRHLSLVAVRRRAKVTRPQAHTRRMPAHEAGVHVGRAHHRALHVTHEDSMLYVGGPRSGKSGKLACDVVDAAGAVLVTSTRADLYTNTAAARRERGRVETLNPGRDGGIPSAFRWSPLDGCNDPQEAIAAAAGLMAAAPQDEAKDAYWTEGAAELLQLLMHAAILGGYSIRDVRSWIPDPRLAADHALTVLDNHPMAADKWCDRLADILLSSDDTPEQASIQNAALSALRWLNDPAMAAIATAPPNQWFDAEAFIDDGAGTIYLIGQSKSLAPFFAAFTGHLFRAAKRIASVSPGHRLDPPLTLALDEAAIICPVPLDDWSAEAGGHGVTLIAALQSPSQLKARWGEHGGNTIWNNMTAKLVFGGLALAADLEAISAVCGDHDTWERVKDADGKKRRQPAAPRRTFPSERIRLLPEGKALLLHRRTRPLIVSVPQVWDRPGYTPVTVHPQAPMAPLDGTVMAPAIPGHLTDGPLIAAAAPTRAVAAPTPILEEATDGQD